MKLPNTYIRKNKVKKKERKRKRKNKCCRHVDNSPGHVLIWQGNKKIQK